VSEVYQGSETAPSAGDAGSTAPYDAGGGPASADNTASYPDSAPGDDFAGYSDADIDAILAAEDQLPEPRTRQEAASATWDDDSPDDPVGDELAAEYDGDVAAFLAAEEQLPEPRTRQEAAAATWDDTTQPDDDPGSFAGDPAAEYDGDVAAFLAAEDQLPEPRTRQEAAAATWDDTSTSQATEPDTSTDSTSPSPPDTVTEPPARHDEGEDGAPDPYEHQVAVHTAGGADVPVTVEYLPPEARTVGDTTPTGIGRKPTGEEFLDMESDDLAESSLDKLLRRANEGADDLRDTISNTAETLHDLRLPGPALDGGHAHAGQPVHDSAPPAGPAFSDVTGSAVLVGVALLTGIRHVVRQLGKGDGR
jgi:hypothetical protein